MTNLILSYFLTVSVLDAGRLITLEVGSEGWRDCLAEESISSSKT